MKLIVCDKCKTMKPLGLKKVSCKWGLISGAYHANGLSAWVDFHSFKHCRVLAIDTNLIQGKVERSQDYVFDWENSGLEVFYNGKGLQKTPENYAEKNAKVFLGNAVECLVKSDIRSNVKLAKILRKTQKLIRLRDKLPAKETR